MESGPKILIVEDESLIAMEIERTLKQLGYRIAGKTRNGDKALDLLCSTSPDLALLDINIRGTLNGIDLARIIRREHNFPFVFLTAFSDRETLNSLKDTFPYGYIVKPFTRQDILTAVELALHKFSAEREDGFPTLDQVNYGLLEELTIREYDVLALMHEGLSYRLIGERLFVSVNTVKYHQKSIYAKLGVKSRHEALRVVFE